MNQTRMLCAVTGITAAGAALAYLAGFGPLDPPSGPVVETSPSLADLEAKLETLIAAGSDGSEEGPWEVFRAPQFGALVDSPQALKPIASGRVYVHSVTTFQAYCVVFNGQGGINQSEQPISGEWVDRCASYGIGTSGGGLAWYASKTVEVDAVLEDGLYAAWDAFASDAYIVIRYRTLEEQP